MCNMNLKMCTIEGHGLRLIALIYSDPVMMFGAVCAHLENKKILAKQFPYATAIFLMRQKQFARFDV